MDVTPDAATPDPNLGNRADLDLSPRDRRAGSSGGSRRRWLPIAVLALVVVAGGVIVTKFLTSAVDYFCTVDEVGNRSNCESDRRLRVQGTVEQGSVSTADGVTSFTIVSNGVSMDVVYDGAPGGIFAECQPVVVHGALNSVSNTFEGDRVEVKHDETYEAENSDRIEQAERDGAAGASCPT